MIKHRDVETVDARLTLMAGIFRGLAVAEPPTVMEKTDASEFAGHLAIAREALARIEMHLARALAALTDLYEHSPKIDNGYCAYCRWDRHYDTKGRAETCKNSACLSFHVESAIKGLR